MRAFVVTMTPRRVKLFADGKLKKDVRKTLGKARPPYKCYVYCYANRECTNAERRRAMRETDGMADEWRGMVVGEYICTEEKPIPLLPPLKVFEETQLTAEEYYALHADWRKIRALTISERKMYDRPFKKENLIARDGKPLNQVCHTFIEVKEI